MGCLQDLPDPGSNPDLLHFRQIFQLLSHQRSPRSVQLLSRVQVLSNPSTAARQAALSIINSQSLLRLITIELVMPPNHLILSSPSPPAFNLSQNQGAFPMSQCFTSSSQSIGVSASASVLSMNIQDGFPLGWISLQSKGL